MSALDSQFKKCIRMELSCGTDLPAAAAAQLNRTDTPGRHFGCQLLKAGTSPGLEIERDLGIGSGQINRWRKQFAEDVPRAFPGNGKSRDEELATLHAFFDPARTASLTAFSKIWYLHFGMSKMCHLQFYVTSTNQLLFIPMTLLRLWV
jgi:hypothetical protein